MTGSEASAGASEAAGTERMAPKGRPAPDRARLAAELRVEQIVLLSRHIPTIALGNIANCVLTTGFFWQLGPRWLLLTWLALIVGFSVNRLRAWQRHRGRSRPVHIPPESIRRATSISVGAGLLWGAVSALLFPAASPVHQVLLCFVAGGMAAGGLASLGVIPAAANGYVLGCLTPLILRLAVAGGAIHWFMVVTLSFYAVVLMAFARNAYRSFVEGAELRLANIEQAELLAKERKDLDAANAEVRRLEARMSRSLDAVGDAVSLYDADDRLVIANRAIRQMHPDLYVPGRTYQEIVRGYYAATDLTSDPARLESATAEARTRHRRADGEPGEVQNQHGAWFLTRHFRTEEGGVLVISTDISAAKRAQTELQRARTLMIDAIEAMRDSIAIYDRDDRLVMANEALLRRFKGRPGVVVPGRTYEQIMRSNWSEAEIAADPERYARIIADELELHRRADGAPREILVRGSTWFLSRQFRTADGGVLIVSSDITELKRAESEATRARALVIDAIEAMDDAVSLYDADERLILANGALLKRTPGNDDLFVVGRRYEDCIRGFWGGTSTAPDPASLEELLGKRLDHFRRADGEPWEARTEQGEWFVTRHFRTADGGTISLSTNLTRMKRATEEVEAARQAAEEANKAKSAFLASMTHEIRTPMNGVIGFADLLLDTELRDQQRETVERIRDAGKSLLAIINDILDISKIEAGKLELESIAMSPASIVDAAASMLKPQIVAKGLELQVHHDPGVPPWMLGDPTRVRQILLNLMSNALKFTDAGHIGLRYGPTEAQGKPVLRFEVSDTGIGIPEDRLPLLFQDFTQLDRSTTRRYGGTGLGLSICKRLAEAMGGSIGVSSTPGEGSRFWFAIELTPCAVPAELHTPSRQLAATPARILVAEDLPMNQLIVQGMLTAEGHRVVLVENGLQAVAAVQQDAFDLILMDMEMPEMDGIGATQAIRALQAPIRDIPIIALTANAMLEDAAACTAAGMNDFLSKPIDRKELAAKVAKWSRAASSEPVPVGPVEQEVQVLDQDVLANLERLLGKETVDRLRSMLGDRLREVRPIFADRKDQEQMARQAHDLVSLAGNLGCKELEGAARSVLTALRTDSGDIAGLTDALENAADRALVALSSRFAA